MSKDYKSVETEKMNPHELNLFLRSQIEDLLCAIDHDAKRNALYPVSKKENDSQAPNLDKHCMLKELERVNARISKIKDELKRSKQESSTRAVEDRMRSTRKELDAVNSELDSLRATAARQQRVIEGLNRQQLIIKELETEISKEKKIYQQLKKNSK